MSILSPKRWKANIEPQLHWRVPFEPGVYGTSPRWSNKDLDPIPPERRTWGGLVRCSSPQPKFLTKKLGLLGILDV
jgi:hypothetical protein